MAAVSDSHAAFERAFDAHSPAVLRFAMRRVQNPVAAQDVTAEAFLAAWRHWDRRPVDPTDHLFWLYRFAANVLLNAHRTETRTVRLAARMTHEASTAVTSTDPTASVAELAELADAMESLSPSDQQVLQLLAWERVQTSEELGLALGISSAAARVRMHRARRRLARALEVARAASSNALHDERHTSPRSHGTTTPPEEVGNA